MHCLLDFLGSLGEKMTMLHNGTFRSILHPLSVYISNHIQPCATQGSVYVEKRKSSFQSNRYENGHGFFFPTMGTDHNVRLIKKSSSEGGEHYTPISHTWLVIYFIP